MLGDFSSIVVITNSESSIILGKIIVLISLSDNGKNFFHLEYLLFNYRREESHLSSDVSYSLRA